SPSRPAAPLPTHPAAPAAVNAPLLSRPHSVRRRRRTAGRNPAMLQLLLIFGAVVSALVALWLLAGIRFVRNDRVGIVEKRFGGRGVRRGLIALADEPGFRPELLRGGLYWLMPFVYRVHVVPLVTIPQGKIGYVYARAGAPLESDQVLASNAQARDFE